MTARSSQKKGADGEREVAALLTALFGVEVRRGASPYLPGWQAPDVFGLAGVHIECKRVQRLDLCAALRQARRDSDGKVGLVLHRRNRELWVASVLLADLPGLVAALAPMPKVLPARETGQTLDSELPGNHLGRIGQPDRKDTHNEPS